MLYFHLIKHFKVAHGLNLITVLQDLIKLFDNVCAPVYVSSIRIVHLLKYNVDILSGYIFALVSHFLLQERDQLNSNPFTEKTESKCP